MTQPLRILILEDNPADAELVQFELQDAGIVFTAKVVMTEKDFIREILAFSPDLILSDYDLPKYNGALALAEARRRCPDTPFILVTGAVTEDRAIDILTQGAKDYVLKTKLQQRLVPAIKRALAEAAEHKARKAAEAELREAHITLEERVKTRTAELEAEIARRKETEDALLKSEAMLMRAQRVANLGSWEWDIITEELYWSDEVYRIFGLTPGEITPSYEKFLALMNPGDRDAVKMAVEGALAGKPYRCEYSLTQPDSTIRYVLAHGDVDFDPAGKPIRMVGTALDITERRKAEEVIQDSEKRYRRLFEAARDGILILDAATGKIDDVNPFLIKLLGYSYDELYGKYIWELGVFKDIAASKEAFQTLQDNEYIRYDDLPLEIVNGQCIAVEFVSNVYLVDHHKVIQFNIRDITAQQLLKEEKESILNDLQKERDRLQALINGINDEIWFADIEKQFTLANPSALHEFGLNSDADAIDIQKFAESLEVYRPDGSARPVAEAPPLRALAGETVRNRVEMIRTPATGEIRYRQVSANPVRDAGGRIIGSVSVVRDITESKRAEEALKESEKKYRELVKYAPVGIYEIDFRSRRFVTVNDAMILLTGYSKEELLSLDVLNILHDESKIAFMARINKMLKGEKPDENVKYKVIAKDGHIIDAILNLSFKFDEQGKPIGAMVIGLDVTSRKRAETTLLETTRHSQ